MCLSSSLLTGYSTTFCRSNGASSGTLGLSFSPDDHSVEVHDLPSRIFFKFSCTNILTGIFSSRVVAGIFFLLLFFIHSAVPFDARLRLLSESFPSPRVRS